MKKPVYILLVVYLLFGVAVAFTHIFGNLWFLLTGNGYFVPSQSSVFSFRPTEDSGGNADWWVRGEDWSRYYALDRRGLVYWVYPKAKVANCPGFNPSVYDSWCSAFASQSQVP